MSRKKTKPPSSGKLVQGRVSVHPDGYAFVTPDEGDGTDIFLPQAQMHTAMHGDHVAVWPGKSGRKPNKVNGLFHKVLKREHSAIIGRLNIRQKHSIIVPENPRILHEFETRPNKQAHDGDMVVADITEFPQNWHRGRAKISRVLSDSTRDQDTDFAIASFNLPHTWSHELREELSQLDTLEDEPARKDLTALPFVTIDGQDAKDFDDAVCAVPAQGGGWTLWVAIADVAHYVRPGTQLDTEALQRGTSIYFPNRVIPMLPAELSNDLCSLRPNVERKVLVCEMKLDTKAAQKSAQFYLATIRSHARLTYSIVDQALFKKIPEVQKKLADHMPALTHLKDLYQCLIAERHVRGALSFDTPECRFRFNSKGQVTRLEPLLHLPSHQLIEECMIAANIAAARHLEKHGICSLYRVHDKPQDEKLNTLRAFVASLGLPFTATEPVTPLDCAKLLEAARDSEYLPLVERALLRAQSLSIYSPDNIGHFGLALDQYAHFTSPIRRYPDLCVHRAIRHSLEPKKSSRKLPSYKEISSLGKHCSMVGRRADEAGWDVEAALKCRLAEQYVGQTRDGIINTVTAFGLFVELEGLFTEGLIHIRQLRGDYYQYDAEAQSLRGERKGKTWQLGQRVTVRIESVNLRERKISLTPVN